jgi:hypothetical protein
MRRFLERRVDQPDRLVEVLVAANLQVGDHHVAEMVGDAGRPRVVVLRLHDGVGGRRRDAEGKPPGKIVTHRNPPDRLLE